MISDVLAKIRKDPSWELCLEANNERVEKVGQWRGPRYDRPNSTYLVQFWQNNLVSRVRFLDYEIQRSAVRPQNWYENPTKNPKLECFKSAGYPVKRKSSLSTLTGVAGLLCRIRSNWSVFGERGAILLGGGALACGVLCATFETNMVESTTRAVSPSMNCPAGPFRKGLARPWSRRNPRIDLVRAKLRFFTKMYYRLKP